MDIDEELKEFIELLKRHPEKREEIKALLTESKTGKSG